MSTSQKYANTIFIAKRIYKIVFFAFSFWHSESEDPVYNYVVVLVIIKDIPVLQVAPPTPIIRVVFLHTVRHVMKYVLLLKLEFLNEKIQGKLFYKWSDVRVIKVNFNDHQPNWFFLA